LEALAISGDTKYDGFPEHESQGKSNGSSRVSFISLPKFSAILFRNPGVRNSATGEHTKPGQL